MPFNVGQMQYPPAFDVLKCALARIQEGLARPWLSDLKEQTRNTKVHRLRLFRTLAMKPVTAELMAAARRRRALRLRLPLPTGTPSVGKSGSGRFGQGLAQQHAASELAARAPSVVSGLCAIAGPKLMTTMIESWNGDDWETHVGRLLQDRHGAINLQKVPAKHLGDGGLDYYCASEAVIYQCYAVEEPIDVATRSSKQKSKITADIGKLCRAGGVAAKLFKPNPISRWILAVPKHDSQEVNSHAAAKAEEVRKLGLAHIAPDFEILIHDRDDFDDDSWARRASMRARLRPVISPATDQEVADIETSSVDLVDNLRRKLAKRTKATADLEDDVDVALRSFVEYQNALDFLRANAPDAHEEIVALTAQRLKRLKLVGAKASESAANILEVELDNLTARFKERVPNLDPDTAEQLAFGVVSEWLMRCPLDFA